MAIVEISAIKLNVNANQTIDVGITDGLNQNKRICGIKDKKKKTTKNGIIRSAST
jgi:hypothetical protein